MTISFNHRRFVKILITIVGILAVLHLVFLLAVDYGIESIGGFSSLTARGLFDLDDEGNIPTWFSSLLLCFAAVTLCVCCVACRKKRPIDARYWSSLAVLFTYFSLDEAAQLHERLSNWIQIRFELPVLFHYPWVIPFAALVVVCILVYIRFLLSLSPYVRATLIGSAVVYIAGALGMELLAGIYIADKWPLIFLITVEESLEMLGVVLFVRGLLIYLREDVDEFRIRFV